MRHFLLVPAVAAVVAAAAGQDADLVRQKLDAAKEAFNREVLKYQVAAADWLNKQEDAARAKGDKKLLDVVNGYRKVYQSGGDLPAAAPKALRSQLDAPRKSLEASYADGIKAYVKARRDDAVATAEAELTKLRYSASALGRTVGDLPFKLYNKHSARLMATHEGSKAPGVPAIQFDDTGGADQRWKLIPADEDFFLIQNPYSGLYLGKTLKDDRAVVMGKLYDGDAVKNQHWRPVATEAGWFLFQNRGGGKYLSVDNGSREPGAGLIHYKLNGTAGSADQWWRFEK